MSVVYTVTPSCPYKWRWIRAGDEEFVDQCITKPVEERPANFISGKGLVADTEFYLWLYHSSYPDEVVNHTFYGKKHPEIVSWPGGMAAYRREKYHTFRKGIIWIDAETDEQIGFASHWTFVCTNEWRLQKFGLPPDKLNSVWAQVDGAGVHPDHRGSPKKHALMGFHFGKCLVHYNLPSQLNCGMIATEARGIAADSREEVRTVEMKYDKNMGDSGEANFMSGINLKNTSTKLYSRMDMYKNFLRNPEISPYGSYTNECLFYPKDWNFENPKIERFLIKVPSPKTAHLIRQEVGDYNYNSVNIGTDWTKIEKNIDGKWFYAPDPTIDLKTVLYTQTRDHAWVDANFL